MKMLLRLTAILLVTLFLVSCDFSTAKEKAPVEYQGINEFENSKQCPNCSSPRGLYNVLSKNFIDEFEYTDADYYFFCNPNLETEDLREAYQHKALLYFQYDDDAYSSAKGYLFETFELSKTPIKEYNGYAFYYFKNLYSGGSQYPYEVTFLAVNDAKNTVVLVQLLISEKYHTEFYKANYDFPTILDVYFGEFYSFE